MQLTPYLNFNGECAAAFAFYAQCLGGRIVSTHTYGESPMRDQTPPDMRDRIMHTQLAVGDQVLMGSDAPPQLYATPQGIHVSVNVKSSADGERIFKALAEGGRMTMRFQKTFWSPGFGMLVDRFGIPWMVNCEAE